MSKGPSIYCASDKNVFDALQNKKISVSDLRNYLLDRGVVASPTADREQLSDIISMLPFDYYSYKYIAEKIESHSRKDNLTSFKISCPEEVSVGDLMEVAQAFKSEKKEEEESCDIKRVENTVTLDIEYTDIDFTKNELAQRSTKTVKVELVASGKEIMIRYSASKKGEKICKKIESDLASKFSSDDPSSFQPIKISLSSLTDPIARSYFFDQLCRYISGYKLVNVTGVDVHRRNDKDDSEDHSRDVASYIDKARLKGQSVLNSVEFAKLNELGFYIYYLCWQVVPQSGVGDKIEYEAKFEDPVNCERFNYGIRGIFNYNKGAHNKGHRQPTAKEKKEYIEILEDSAHRAFEATVSNYGESQNEG